MALNAGLFSSATGVWGTPPELFSRYNDRYGFELDVCALPSNAKCDRYFTPEDDGLTQDWAPSRCWMNPPYGKGIDRWMRKAWEEAQRGALVVCLVPSRTDTRWWHDWAMLGQVEFLRGRLRFEGGASTAPFPSAIVTYLPYCGLMSRD